MNKVDEAIAIMVEAGVFDIRNGSAELHFDSEGLLASIDLHQKAFRRQRLSTIAIVKNP